MPGSIASKRACTRYNPGRANVCAGHISIKRLTAENFPPGRTVWNAERSGERKSGSGSQWNTPSGPLTSYVTRARDPLSDAVVIPGVDGGAVDDLQVGRQYRGQLRDQWTPHAVGRGRGDHQRQAEHLGGLGQRHHVVFQIADRDVPHAAVETDLVVDEHQRGVVPGQGLGELARGHGFSSDADAQG